MSHRRPVTVLRSSWTGYAIGLALVVAVVPASFAQNPPVPDHGMSAGTGLSLESREHSGVSVDEPIGRVRVGPESLEGEPTYVRRTIVSQGLTVVEISTTPFMPVLAFNEANVGGALRPDQPAGW